MSASEADDAVVQAIHLGLVVEDELAAGEGVLDLADQAEVGPHAGFVGRVEETEAVLPGQLCCVHRLVGVAQQLIRIHRVAGEEGCPDAGGDAHLLVVDGVGRGQGVQDALECVLALATGVQITDQQGELVAADARSGVFVRRGP